MYLQGLRRPRHHRADQGIDADVLRAIAEEILASLDRHGGATTSDDPTPEVTGPRSETADPSEGDGEQSRGVAV